MSQQDLPEELKNMLLNDELKEVIDRLRAHLPELRGQVTEEELLQYAARLNAVEREWKLGIITAERYGIEKNQLRQILSFKPLLSSGKQGMPRYQNLLSLRMGRCSCSKKAANSIRTGNINRR